MENKVSKPKILRGEVIAHKGNKTAVVLVNRFVKHPKYKKYQKISKKYQVHDPENSVQAGDKVVIEERKPISKTKRFVIKK